jgi:diguanylate cyclase (GGDEF)-like protein
MKALATALLLALAASVIADERGLPLIEIHEQRRHGAGSQVFDVTQAADGMLYFGGLKGVTTYDGAWWRTLALPNESAVFSVESGRGPELAVGAVDELGWVAPDPNGTLEFHSLRPFLPAEQRNVGDVRAICTTGSGFLYVAEQAVLSWSGGAPRIVADLRAKPELMPRCFRSRNTTYVALAGGLQRYDESTGALVRAGYDGKTVDAVLPFGNRDLVVVRGEGLYAGGTPFQSGANEWLRDKMIVTAAVLPGNRFLIGSRQDGVLILDANGGMEQYLDSGAGLPGHVLSGSTVDREGSLWLAYYGSIARLELDSPVTMIDTRRGLRGSPNSIGRHQGRLYITSSHGLFASDGSGAFTPVGGLPVPVWDVVSLGDELLISTREGVFLGTGDQVPRRIEGTESVVAYSMLRSKKDPAQIWLATKRGVASIRRGPGGWTYAGVLPDSPPHTHNIVEVADGLWAGTVFEGAVHFDLSSTPPRVERYGKGELHVAEIDGRAVVTDSGVIYEPDHGRLTRHSSLGHLRDDFYLVAQDTHGNVWTNATPPQLVLRLGDGRYAADPIRIGSVDVPKVSQIKPDGDVVWLASPDAVHRYEATRPPAPLPQPAPLIRRAVTADEKPVLAPLDPSFGRVRIEFAPSSYRPGVVYQYRLDPVDVNWSAWIAQPSIDYTNLDHGDYTFRVRARGAGGTTSDETRWSFSVLPPWYRTRAALMVWLLLAAIVIALIVRLRTTALTRQAQRLRALVEDRTDELQQANAHLERLSLLDELTGIANRRYFQRALVEDWRNSHEQQQPLALILFDLDYFKQLNDRYGHAAGDAALIRVARHLSRRSRRSGDFMNRSKDLVARIGGEEFALVLAHTSEEEAVRIADTLRAGIERLPIELTGGSVHVTASAGVAAVVPRDSESWNTLLRDADRALYAAKAAGRNCVRAWSAGEESAPPAPYAPVQT